MGSNIKYILDYQSLRIDADRLKLTEVLNNELLKFDFEEDYLAEGNLQIEKASTITFHSCTIENFTETRSINESSRPNSSGVPQGSKRISEFNVWDYELSFSKEFQNSNDSHDILESHHAIGCSACKQQGKIRCSSCRGAGEQKCSSCDGRGEKKCSSCNGHGKNMCKWCWGSGTTTSGFGEDKRKVKCSICSGSGYNKCSSCSNGFISCSTCSSSGKVSCYHCYGAGEVTCYECDGHRTMDHYFIVSADFINLSQTLYLTNSLPGFDHNKSKKNNFNIQNKLFEIQEAKFNESHFEEIKSSSFYRQLLSFLDFTNNERTKLILSRITCYENIYFEVAFNFYGEKYTLFLDKNCENSYYNDKKPSDQYELDLLKKSIESSVENELSITKKTIQRLSKFDFIDISEKELINAIDSTNNIYQAFDDYQNKNYSKAEKTLRLTSDLKKSEDDYSKLRKSLNKTYLLNTVIIGLIGVGSIYYKLIDKVSEFQIINISISLGIILFCLLINISTKSIHLARLLVLFLFGVQHFGIYSIETKNPNFGNRSSANQVTSANSRRMADSLRLADWFETQRLENARLEQERQEATGIANERLEQERKESTKLLNEKQNIDYRSMIYVEGGSFQMGCSGNDCERDESPVHTVTLASYNIGKYEVTLQQWREVMGNNPNKNKNCDSCPVENVSWNDVQGFIRKLNSQTGKKYRLPTEAEWEFAARGGNKSNGTSYSGSNNLNSVAWYSNNSEGKTHPVGGKSPNELGIYDMSGNVWEWCSDWYSKKYYKRRPQSGPRGPSSGSDRVLRGGSSSSSSCRVSYRNNFIPDSSNSLIGFRLVLDL